MKVLVAAGGTGGHLFPAVAVIEELQKRFPGTEALFVGNSGKIEARVVPQLGYQFQAIPISGLSKILSLSTLTLPLNIIRSIFVIRQRLRSFRPDIVLCTGAYISYPAALVASWEGIPLVLMESNVYPGKAIKMLANRTDRILLSFDESKKYFSDRNQAKLETIGNPVRGRILTPPSREAARKVFSLDNDRTLILAVGGSLGARSINQAMEKIAPSHGGNVQWLWQTGAQFDVQTGMPENVRAMKFIDDMASAYAAADLVIARAGATTLAELTAIGKPSILVPFPHAANNHQEHNARLMQEAGASRMIYDHEIDTKLERTINEILNKPELLREMAANARKLGRPDAAVSAAERIAGLVH